MWPALQPYSQSRRLLSYWSFPAERKMSMGNRHTERPPDPVLYGGRPSGGFVNRAVSCPLCLRLILQGPLPPGSTTAKLCDTSSIQLVLILGHWVLPRSFFINLPHRDRCVRLSRAPHISDLSLQK